MSRMWQGDRIEIRGGRRVVVVKNGDGHEQRIYRHYADGEWRFWTLTDPVSGKAHGDTIVQDAAIAEAAERLLAKLGEPVIEAAPVKVRGTGEVYEPRHHRTSSTHEQREGTMPATAEKPRTKGGRKTTARKAAPARRQADPKHTDHADRAFKLANQGGGKPFRTAISATDVQRTLAKTRNGADTGGVPKAQVKKHAQGGEISEDHRAALKALAAKIDDPRISARKMAAILAS